MSQLQRFRKQFIFVFLISICLVGLDAKAASVLYCHDTDTFNPLEFTLEDDDVGGPAFSFDGLSSRLVIAKLGLLLESESPWKAQNLTLVLPNQPQKSINPEDHRIRIYTVFGITGNAKAKYFYDGKLVEKEVTFSGFETIKSTTAASAPLYSLILKIQHSGKDWVFEKHYYSYSCT